jgi:hypothetical protein
MKKSELKALINEVIEEMAGPKKLNASKRKAKAASKGYTLKPSPDPVMNGEMELRVKGKVVAHLWYDQFPGEHPEHEKNVIYAIYPSDNEYAEFDTTIEDVAKWIIDQKAWTWQ